MLYDAFSMCIVRTVTQLLVVPTKVSQVTYQHLQPQWSTRLNLPFYASTYSLPVLTNTMNSENHHAHAIVLIKLLLTLWWISKLSTDNTGICLVPKIVTYCTPPSIHADLHTPLIICLSTNQPKHIVAARPMYRE